MRVLVAVDGSACSTRAVKYAGEVLRTRPDVEVMVFHVLDSIPPMLREHGGSENPTMETRLRMKLRKAQQAWYKQERAIERRILKKAQTILEDAGLDGARIQTQFGYEQNVARNILEKARSSGYHTIVVGRHGRSGIRRLSWGGVTQGLLRNGHDLTIWVVQ